MLRPDTSFLCWLISVFLTHLEGEFSLHKNVIGKLLLHVSAIYFSVSSTKNNVSSETFYFLMDTTNSYGKASFFKRDVFINWKWKPAGLGLIIHLTHTDRADTLSWHDLIPIWDISLSPIFISEHCHGLTEWN